MNIEHDVDEIDLMDVLSTIWKGRYILLMIIIISVIVGFLVLRSLPSYYAIDATIDSIGKEGYHQLYPSVLSVPEYQVPKPDHRRYYDRLLLQISSLNMAKAFWKEKTGKELNDEEILNEFNSFYRNLNLEAKNNKSPEITARKLNFLHVDSHAGVELLNEYLIFLNKQLWYSLSSEMLGAYQSSLSALNSRYVAKNSLELQKLNDDLIRLKESKLIAQSLKIEETPYASLENIQLKILDGKDYLLGANLLNQQIKILTERAKRNLSPFSRELRDLESSMQTIKSDMEKLESIKHIKMFDVVNEPQSTLRPVKPNRTLLLFGIVCFSTLLGVIYLLLRHSLIKRNQVSDK